MIKIYGKISDIKFKSNDVFLHFTGNVWGIGCSAFDIDAINKIKKLKNRDDSKGFILLFSSFEQIKQYPIQQIDDFRIYTLLNQYFPGNLTAILPTSDNSFESVALNGKVGIRIPRSKFLRDFIDSIGVPIVSTSINVSDEPMCNDLTIIQDKYTDWFDFGLQSPSEQPDLPLPSTVIDFADGQVKCLREGSIPFSEIEMSYKRPLIQFVCIGNICRSPLAEFYFSHLIMKKNMPFRAASCGLFAVPQKQKTADSFEIRKISPQSLKILMENQIHATDRTSIQISDDIIRESSLLLCMTREIADDLCSLYPSAVGNVYTLAEASGNELDIDDPYGCDENAYLLAWTMIKKYCDDLEKMLGIL
jgi:L-threonylcarbamoyladenylate synthase